VISKNQYSGTEGVLASTTSRPTQPARPVTEERAHHRLLIASAAQVFWSTAHLTPQSDAL